ncbi:MAG: pyridoxamine 5'-phosphate oxidase family protein [Verrucomicrobiota bacterium]|nr:pyridoxamine 5'-phosphate oxidase family protein [Verrucomicrobiota bacterium]
MAGRFMEIALTDSVRAAQEQYYGKPQRIPAAEASDPLTEDEIQFIRQRDSFYMATVNEEGWPFIQHRGGQAGFLKVISPGSLAFADYKGNRQMLSTGNISKNPKVSLFLMDYPGRTRLKIIGKARVVDIRDEPDLTVQLAEPEMRSLVERAFFIEVVSYDWNCPKYITPRYTSSEIEELILPLKRRITELENLLSRKKS